MTDFENIIRTAINSGKSVEDIASEAGAILNKIQDECSSKRENKLNEIEKRFHEAYHSQHLNLSNLGDLAALVMAESHPEWNAENFDEYSKLVVDTCKTNARFIGHDPEEVFSNILGELVGDMLKQSANETRGKKTKTDEESVMDFLRSLE